MPADPRLRAYLALAATAIGWSLSPVFIRYLSEAYDPYSQAFIRYLSGTVCLLLYSGLFYRSGMLEALRRPAVLGLALTNVLMQTLWTVGTYHSTATLAGLITKVDVVFVILLSFLLFRDERAVIRNPRYLLGTALSFLGLAGVLIKDPSVSLLPELNLGTVLLLLFAAFWAVYAVWGRHTVMDLSPIPMFTIIACYSTIGFGVLSWTLGDPHTLLSAGPRITTIALISGTLPIAIAHACFHHAQKRLGSAFCASVLLLNPLVTHLAALALWPESEALRPLQWAGGILLVAGTALVIRAEQKKALTPR